MSIISWIRGSIQKVCDSKDSTPQTPHHVYFVSVPDPDQARHRGSGYVYIVMLLCYDSILLITLLLYDYTVLFVISFY